MPNHVINEVIFRGVDADKQAAILAKVKTADRPVDFGVLLPIPLNIWQGSVGSQHEKAFPGNALDWCSANWSTKWNAYGLDEGDRYRSVVQDDDTLTLTFQTAWGPPMGWIVALFNAFQLPFEYRWLSEGGEAATVGKFAPFNDDNIMDQPWSEVEADEPTARHLHKLLWGAEVFTDEDE